ncbi:response regulator transcription factor [Raoultibacter massiliensis]|uniref:Response regulator transcription factor n=1 Tax=Raoultibacter massiliensis TaxID=1852371 RepID=A0ABV1JC14_9ACTN
METTSHICVCDDEAAIADLVRKLLADEGYRPSVCYSAAQVLDLMTRDRFDLVILDIMMPGIDGFTCCREIRKKSQVPVIFLTAKDEEIDKVVGFELGADDYVVKPFKPRELMARVKARLRRTSVDASRVQAQSVLEAGGVTIDEAAYTASVLGEELALTPKEYAILLCLAKQAGRPVASSELFEAVWGEPASVQGNNTVMVHIRHLRKKIAAIDSSQEYIETVWGVGYKLG